MWGGGNLLNISAQEVSIGSTDYPTLAEAFAAAQEGETITVLKDLEITEMIPVTKSVNLDLNGKTITSTITGNRMFRLSGVTFTIDGKNGKIFIPESNLSSYGFVDFRDASNAASADAKLIASDVSFEGGTDQGSLFAFRTSGQSIDFNNVNVNLTGGYAYSIINGYQCTVDINITGGEYICSSTNQTAGVFQAYDGSNINFDGVKVTTSVGPIFEVIGENTTATFTNCDMTNTATNSFFASCLASSNGAKLTVNGGTYTANYPLYIYNSGGSIDVEGGEFNGNIASIKADNKENAAYESVVTVADGTFTGPISVDNRSKVEVAEDSSMVETTDADGKIVYIAAPTSSDIAAFVGTTSYSSLADAFAAVEDGQRIVLFKDQDLSETTRIIDKSVTLDLNGKTITNNVMGNALFCITGGEFTIDGKSDIGDAVGKIVTPDTNTSCWGWVAFTAKGLTSANTKLTATDVDFEGIIDDAGLFRLCADGQSIDFTNVNVNLKSSQARSIINGYDYKGLTINIKGGTYNYDSTLENMGVFQANASSVINFDGVTVNTNRGPVFEVYGSTAKFTDCIMTNTSTNGFCAACIAPSNGSQVTIEGGTYTANYPLYIYTTGGTLNVDGGNFIGSEAALMVSNQDGTAYPSVANISDGYFEGPLKTSGSDSVIQIKGGTYSEKPAEEYCASGYKPVENGDGTFGVQQDSSTGIDDLEATEADDVRIYNLYGERICSDVKSLPAGIYIIGGRKVVIRNR